MSHLGLNLNIKKCCSQSDSISPYRAGPNGYLLLYDLPLCTNGIVTIINVFETTGSRFSKITSVTEMLLYFVSPITK